MSDWADYVAKQLLFNHDESEVRHDDVAAALRKAKAQGMMEAAQSLAPSDPALASDLIARASKIENPTP